MGNVASPKPRDRGTERQLNICVSVLGQVYIFQQHSEKRREEDDEVKKNNYSHIP